MATGSSSGKQQRGRDVTVRFPRLSLAERDRRWQLLRARMDAEGIDCLLVHGKPSDMGNAAYVTSVFVLGQGILAVLPKAGPVTAFMAGNLANIAMWRAAQDWVPDIRPVPQHLAWSKAAADTVNELGLGRGRLGIVGLSARKATEVGAVAHGFVEALKQKLPEATLVDATELVENARIIKGPEEISFIQKASDIGEQALGTVARYVKSGITSRSAAAYFVWAMLEHGSTEAPFLLWDAGPNVVHGVWQFGDYFLRPGDVIVTEFSALVCGYGAQFQRPMAVGHAPEIYERLFDAAASSYWAGLETLRPGVTFGEVTQAMARPIEQAGFTTVTPYYHGFGLGLEFPVSFSGSRLKRSSLATPTLQKQLEEDQIKAGMVLAMEPNAVTPDDSHGVHVGDTVVVTETGVQRLSRLPLEWIVV